MVKQLTTVDSLHEEFTILLDFLDDARELSLRSIVDGNFRKTLLLATASYFEHHLKESLIDFVEQTTARDHVVKWLIMNKVVERQYHMWFDWDAKNANHFFKMFGESFLDHMKTAIANSGPLSSSVRAFLEIGRDRNRLVHDNFGSFTLEKTSDEIYQTYQLAREFVEWFPEELRRFANGGQR